VSPSGPAALVAAARAAGVRDSRVLDAFAAVDRAGFVPPQHVGVTHLDRPVPIAHAQVTTQPSLVAPMIEALALDGTQKVLEIGTGLGFQTALLARLAARVWSVERFADLAKQARANLAAAGVANVEVIVADGSEGPLAQRTPSSFRPPTLPCRRR
jgi:protein-L-isoaspartate(D-aspartate) O-methyltransferase